MINGILAGYQYASTLLKRSRLMFLKNSKRLKLVQSQFQAITLAELRFGIMKSSNVEKNSEALERFLTPLDIIDFDYNSAIEYGKIRADLEKKRTPIGPLDMLIASHAKSLDLTLITNNEREFNRISELKVENWTL